MQIGGNDKMSWISIALHLWQLVSCETKRGLIHRLLVTNRTNANS
jgi:hypothetical protein